MKRKKGGNSLIVVVTTCMFVTTVSAATLTMVSGNYKARVVESKRVENLYSSDSGLDVTYNILGKTFDAATQYGYYEVQALKNNRGNSPYKEEYNTKTQEISDLKNEIKTLEEEIKNGDSKLSSDKSKISQDNATIENDNERISELIKLEFKRTFKSFIYPTSDYENNYEEPPNKLLTSIENSSYINEVSYDSEKQQSPFTFNSVNVQYADDTGREIAIPENGVSYDDSRGEYTIIVQSSFETTSGNTSVIGENSRTVQATYVMTVPDYDDIFYQQVSGEPQEYLALKGRALTIGGDMKVSNADNLEINGNAFVNGNEPTTSQSDRVYKKYSGGITISNSNNVNFDYDVITRNTFNVQSSGDAEVKGNIYGRNVYVGGNISDGVNGFASDATLTASGVILDNDLALKATTSTITIDDFYGINDKNISYDDLNPDPAQHNIISGVPGDKVKSSSSIIVNGNDDLTRIKINRSAYIMGTAHIDTIDTTGTGSKDGYQTGESGAVKGNYIAYSVPLSEAEKFDYYEPMQLLDDPNVFNKANHFASYWSGNNIPSTGGIHLPSDTSKIYSVGAIVFQDENGNKKVMRPNYLQSLEASGGAIYNTRKDFASKVYKFDGDATITDYDDSNEIGFDSLMYLDGISAYSFDDQLKNSEYAIFNKDSNKEIQIKKTDKEKDSITDNGNNVIEVDVAKKDTGYTLDAVIATAGNVSIEDDDIILTGNIVCNGDLNIKGSDVKINYNEDAIDRIEAQNYNLFKNVFVNSISSESQVATSSSTSQTTTGSTNHTITYDLKRYLQSNKWRIIK